MHITQRLFSFLLPSVTLFLAIVLASGCQSNRHVSSNSPDKATENHKPIHVLMIGNSYTRGVSKFATAWTEALPKQKVMIDFAANGGWSLQIHYNGREQQKYDPKEAPVSLTQLMEQTAYDVIIVQEQSTGATSRGKPEQFHESAATLINWLRQMQAEKHAGHQPRIVMYQTWPRHPDWDGFKDGYTYEQMHEEIRSNYRKAAQDNHAELMPVGDAFVLFYEQPLRPGNMDKMHQDDLSHPAGWGGTIAGLMVCQVATQSMLENCPPPDLPWLGKPTPEQMALMQKITQQVWSGVPDPLSPLGKTRKAGN